MKKRKVFLEQGHPFVVPKSTLRRRRLRWARVQEDVTRRQRESNNSGVADTSEGTSAMRGDEALHRDTQGFRSGSPGTSLGRVSTPSPEMPDIFPKGFSTEGDTLLTSGETWNASVPQNDMMATDDSGSSAFDEVSSGSELSGASDNEDLISEDEDLDGDDVGLVSEDEDPVCEDETPSVNLEANEHHSSNEQKDASADPASLLFGEHGSSKLPNSTTTVAEAVIMITAFIVAHGLSWTALDHLLIIVNALFGTSKNVLPRSKYLFRNMWTQKTETMMKNFYYCKICTGELIEQVGTIGLRCKSCKVSYSIAQVKKSNSFFSILSMNKQVKHIVSKTSEVLHANLQKIVASPSTSSIRDITDGDLYRNLRSKGVLQGSDLTITFNTDGSPLYKSSKSSIWPIQFILNELPAKERMENCALAGLWFGNHHPNMGLFMDKFVEELRTMEPVKWQSGSVSHTSSVYGLCCCVDSPARAAVQNQKLFNGHFGCPWCLTVAVPLQGV